MAEKLVNLLADLKEAEALRIVRERLDAGEEPLKILQDARKAMEIVGKRFEGGKYFLPEIVYSGEILNEINAIVKPRLAKAIEIKRLGKVAIGTVEGDIHDIGKNMVTFMLDINGFKVYDLGVDVSPQRFVETIEEVKPEIVGLSSFLTLCFETMRETVEAIKEAGLRDEVKIMIGGNYVNDYVTAQVGADAWGADAGVAVKLAKEWAGGK